MPSRSTREQIALLQTRLGAVEDQLWSVVNVIETLHETLARPGGVFPPADTAASSHAAGAPQVVNHYYLGASAPAGTNVAFTPAVSFSDIALIAAALKPPFGNDEGDYEDPDLVIAGGRVRGAVPANVECPGEFVIYSSWARVVANCQGFGGPNDGNNAVLVRARRNAQQLAGGIDCQDDCRKSVVEIWRGWSCGGNPRPIVATAAVELKVSCLLDV